MRYLLLFSAFISTLGSKFLSIPVGELGRLSLFRISVLLELIYVLTFGARKRKFLIYRRSSKYSVFFMLVWGMWAFISVIWSMDTGDWMRNVFFIFTGIVTVFLYSNQINSIDDIIDCLKALNLGIFLQSLLGWYGVFSKNLLFVNLRTHVYPKGTHVNENDLGTLLFLGICLCVLNIETAQNKKTKISNFLILFEYSILLILTSSRANILAVAIVIILFAIFNHKSKKKILLILMGTAILALPVVSKILGEFPTQIKPGTSEAVRIGLIKNGLYFLEKTFGFGIGAGQVESWMQYKSVFAKGTAINMHNWWMEILVAYGIPVFIGYLFFYFGLMKSFFKRKDDDNRELRWICRILCAYLAGFIISSISSSSNMNEEWVWIFFSICITLQGILPTVQTE